MKLFYTLTCALLIASIAHAQEPSGQIEQDGILIKYEFQKTESEKRKDVYSLHVTAENSNDYDIYYRGTATTAGVAPAPTAFGGVKITNSKGFLAADTSLLFGDSTEYFTVSNEPLIRVSRGKVMSTDMTFKVKTDETPVVIDYFNAALKPLEYYELRSTEIPLPFQGADFAMTQVDYTGSVMPAGYSLTTNQLLSSPNQLFYMNVFADGNVCVLKRTPQGLDDQFLWCSNTNGAGAVRLTLQDDGNLVIYNLRNQALWSTSTTAYFDSKYNDSTKPNRLILDDNGVLHLLNRSNNRVWSSNAQAPTQPQSVYTSNGNSVNSSNGDRRAETFEEDIFERKNALWNGNSMKKNDIIYSTNKQYYLTFQNDGNLVLYENLNGQGRFIWGSMTHDKNAVKVEMLRDGNLVIYDKDNRVVWATNTTYSGSDAGGRSEAKAKDEFKANRLRVDGDGSMSLYSATGNKIWSSQ